VDELVTILHNSNIPCLKIASKDIHVLLYADDIVVLATNVFDLKEKIDLIKDFFMKNDLYVNLEKTKLVIFKDGRRRKRRPMVCSVPKFQFHNLPCRQNPLTNDLYTI
jgi:hypothetical protein